LITRLNQEVARALNAPDTRERLARDGNEVVAAPAEQFDTFFRAQMDKWAKVIRDAGIRLQ
jgi:tripartite-type tricarboxylate transporter receptor subunit TctC